MSCADNIVNLLSNFYLDCDASQYFIMISLIYIENSKMNYIYSITIIFFGVNIFRL